jgi:hypothetical protein
MGGGEGGATVVESGGLGERENGRNIFLKKLITSWRLKHKCVLS